MYALLPEPSLAPRAGEHLRADSGRQGWQARLDLRYAADPSGRTLLTHRRHEGPMLVQRPFHPEGPVCHTYLLHPPGGVVGGDWLDLRVVVGPKAHALLTMPGATKFYRSAGEQALLSQHFHVDDGAVLEWLPQDNIFFAGARVGMRTHFELSGSARLLAWESQCLGRPVLGEAFERGSLRARLSVSWEGRMLLHEVLNVSSPDRFGLGGFPLSATLLAWPADDALLEQVRSLLEGLQRPAGATRLDRLLVLRLLDDDNQRLQQNLQRAWRTLRPLLLERAPCMPRIWAT